MIFRKLWILFAAIFCINQVQPQGIGYNGHYYGANQVSIKRNQVPPREQWPEPLVDPRSSTLRPHLCQFNPFIRKCMDPNNYCPGRCMNFNYVFNSRYDCRCLVI
uniref:Uncharacterized protein n=1 Tax=Panagrolaimus sp. PS1159 TaxID=55785 RepID=A0AC35G474_9BILA